MFRDRNQASASPGAPSAPVCRRRARIAAHWRNAPAATASRTLF
jgi:hypothetical protein